MIARWGQPALWVGMWLLVGCTGGAADDPEASTLLEKMLQRDREIRIFGADIRVAMAISDGVSGSGTGVIIRQNPVKEPASAAKFSFALETVVTVEGRRVVTNIVIVNDGSFVWAEMRGSEVPGCLVIKEKAAGASAHDVAGYPIGTGTPTNWLKDRFEFSMAGEGLVGGQHMTILEGVWSQDYLKENPKDAEKYQRILSKIKCYVGRDDLMVHRIVHIGPKGEAVATWDFENIKINVPVKPEVFQYKPPPGAEIIDRTNEATNLGLTGNKLARNKGSGPDVSGPLLFLPYLQPAKRTGG